MKRFTILSLVIVGAVALTALGIDAADTLSGSRTTLLGQMIATDHVLCPDGMVALTAATTFTCVDIYEVSTNESCPVKNPENILQTSENIDSRECQGVSEPEREPWRFITRDEAQLICTRGGKRLPNNEEWQYIALDTPTASCNIESRKLSKTGAHDECLSAIGAFDTVGNVWEWTTDEVVNGNYRGRTLPQTGFVAAADSSGIAVETLGQPSEQYGKDYFWSRSESVAAIMRGGFYGSKDDAGVYTAHADIALTFSGEAVGFRCVK